MARLPLRAIVIAPFGAPRSPYAGVDGCCAIAQLADPTNNTAEQARSRARFIFILILSIDAMAQQRLFIEADAQARTRRCEQVAVLHFSRARSDRRADRVLADPVLAHDAVGHRDREVRACGDVHGRTDADVRLEGEAEVVGELGDAPAFGDAAGATNVGLHDVDGAVADQLDGFVSRHDRIERDRDRQALRQFGVALDILRRDRHLEEADAELLHRLAEPHRVGARVDTRRVRVDREVVAECVADRADRTQIAPYTATNRHLHAAIAGIAQ